MRLVFPDASGEIVATDPTLLRTTIEILTSNAINYSNKGSDVVVSFKQQENSAIISVQDFGIGIPQEAYPKLFDRFYRASNAIAFDSNGNGLGLYIASDFAKKIGATLTFESELGRGTTFYLTLPHTKE